jgi:type 1 glutamine amidotransferase
MKNILCLRPTFVLLLIALCSFSSVLGMANQPRNAKAKLIKALIIDGQNNHDQWAKVTYMMKRYLEETGKFSVDVQRTKYTWNGKDYVDKYKIAGLAPTVDLPKSKMDSSFHPNFAAYDVVICNFGWNAAPWAKETQEDFDRFVKKGGGLVIIHAADNSFPEWPAYNQMIGIGGWGNRTEKDGPYVYYDLNNQLVRDTAPGRAGSHGPQKDYQIIIRNANHPITKGMPLTWMHVQDEMYDRLRGPAENMEVLGTAFSSIENKGTGRHEPMLLTINYGKGRIFHTPMGHADYSVSCVGFITSILRGTQWAATGKVDIPIPADFPKPDVVSKREFKD